MKTYYITYTFDGRGTAIVRAKNKKEATERFYEGEAEEYRNEDAENYEIDEFTKE